MDATLRFRDVRPRTALVAFVVAIVGLAIVLASASFGESVADGALRAAGGSMDTGRYLLLLQLNADAARFAGAVLLGVGAFVGLRRI